MWLWTARPGRSSWREKASDSSADLPQLPSGGHQPPRTTSLSQLQSSVSFLLGREEEKGGVGMGGADRGSEVGGRLTGFQGLGEGSDVI